MNDRLQQACEAINAAIRVSRLLGERNESMKEAHAARVDGLELALSLITDAMSPEKCRLCEGKRAIRVWVDGVPAMQACWCGGGAK